MAVTTAVGSIVPLVKIWVAAKYFLRRDGGSDSLCHDGESRIRTPEKEAAGPSLRAEFPDNRDVLQASVPSDAEGYRTESA